MEDECTVLLEIAVAARRHHGHRHSRCHAAPGLHKMMMFGVYDGHNGALASAFCKRYLPQALARVPDVTDSALLIDMVNRFDEEFCSDASRAACGSTMVFALVEDYVMRRGGRLQRLMSKERRSVAVKTWRVRVCNVGDSRAMVVRKDGSYQVRETFIIFSCELLIVQTSFLFLQRTLTPCGCLPFSYESTQVLMADHKPVDPCERVHTSFVLL
jgi:hypothetical protein